MGDGNPDPAKGSLEHKLGVVALYAGRVRFWATSVDQAHRFGNPPGNDDEPWGQAFQHQAALVYRDVLPVDYLEKLAAVFLACSLTMEDHPIPSVVAGDWQIVLEYLTNASEAIADVMGFDLFPSWEDPLGHNEPTTPAIVRFDLLAQHASTVGIRRLRDAGDHVARYLADNANTSTGAPSDLHLAIIKDLADGVRVIDIAIERGFSTRSLYRELNDIWKTLGVENKQQAIALAAQNGWLD